MRLLFTALACLIHFSVFGQYDEMVQARFDKKVQGAIKFNLTDLVVGRYTLDTELFLQNQFSVGLNVDYISRGVYIESIYATNRPGDPIYFIGGDTHKRGVILEPQIRWYTSKTDGQGTYVAISGFFGYARYSPIEWEGLGGVEPMEWMAGGSSLQMGHQRSIKRFLFDAYLGVTWTEEPEDRGFDTFRENGIFLPQPTGFRMSGGLSVGILIN